MDKELEAILEDMKITNFELEQPEEVCLKEVIELFVIDTIPKIQREREIPKINFIFQQDAFDLFNEIKDNPFIKKGSITPDIKNEDIAFIYKQNHEEENIPTIKINDSLIFFELLTKLINSQLQLHYHYGLKSSSRNIAMHLMERIWLRMGQDDIKNIEDFLQKQIDFLENREFDKTSSQQKPTQYKDLTILSYTGYCETFYESTRRMMFIIHNGENYHNLPSIYYDIKEENGKKVCYIGAVQTPQISNRIKQVERKLYSLHKEVSNPVVHPNFTMAMKLFYEKLQAHEITEIKVPASQLLLYRYHELLSQKAKENFTRKWTPETLRYMEKIKDSDLWFDKKEYKKLKTDHDWDLKWYSHVVDKASFIEKAKTEGLQNLFFHMTEINTASEITTVPTTENPYLTVTLSKEKQKINKKSNV